MNYIIHDNSIIINFINASSTDKNIEYIYIILGIDHLIKAKHNKIDEELVSCNEIESKDEKKYQ